MTAVPPPVPPEIVERAAKALHSVEGDPLCEDCWGDATTVLAAVYGDIVEAARRESAAEIDRLQAEVERLRKAHARTSDDAAMLAGAVAKLGNDVAHSEASDRTHRRALMIANAKTSTALADRDRAVEAARRDALKSAARAIGDEAAADGVYGTDIQSGLLRAGWIVGNMARHGLSATVSDQQTESAPAPVHDAHEAHKRSEPFLTNAFAVTPEMGRYLDETAPPRTPPCFTALGTEDPA